MQPIPRIGIISQARMSSTRLPGKILKSVGNNSLLQIHLNRLQQSGFPIYLATTTNVSDDRIAEFCTQQQQAFSRGDEQNVLSRFYECALQFKLEVIVRVTSDCPLIDGVLIKDAIEKYLAYNSTSLYYSNCIERTFPRGFDFEIFSFDMLKEAYEKAASDTQKEHVTPYFYQNHENKFTLKHYKAAVDNSHFRISVDTPEDFELIKILIEQYHAATKTASEICELLQQHPELVAINQHIEQKKV